MNYLDRLLRAVQRGHLKLKPRTVNGIEILHDDDCGIWTNQVCDCEPDVYVDTPNGRVYLLPDGTVGRGE
jgi:hypothetical protein